MCEYCKEGKELGFGYLELLYIKEGIICTRRISEGTIRRRTRINYCPFCGEKLNDEE